MHVTLLQAAAAAHWLHFAEPHAPRFFRRTLQRHRGPCRDLAAVDVMENTDVRPSERSVVSMSVVGKDCWPTIPRNLSSSSSLGAVKTGFNDKATRAKSRIIPICP